MFHLVIHVVQMTNSIVLFQFSHQVPISNYKNFKQIFDIIINFIITFLSSFF